MRFWCQCLQQVSSRSVQRSVSVAAHPCRCLLVQEGEPNRAVLWQPSLEDLDSAEVSALVW